MHVTMHFRSAGGEFWALVTWAAARQRVSQQLMVMNTLAMAGFTLRMVLDMMWWMLLLLM